jgi:L-alanine-DL-glutamate epimerase-like enolase superfamily enzyme
MLQASFEKRNLVFKTPAGTSRGILLEKPSWLMKIWFAQAPEVVGVGECSIIPGLSYDGDKGIDEKIKEVVGAINVHGKLEHLNLTQWPSVKFGIETAWLDLLNGGKRHIFPSSFLDGFDGIPINGLIWMGDPTYMSKQVEAKIEDGYRCLKIKIGAIRFEDEFAILKAIRKRFSASDLTLRVDANGAFGDQDVWSKLDVLSGLGIHSVEQPIKHGQWELMRDVCAKSPIPVALDEELIGVFDEVKMHELLSFISPHYLILKPGLLGGFDRCNKWISLATEQHVGWWATSALEGNVGLNAIAQWTATMHVDMPQGLGTGQLFVNNIESPLNINRGKLFYNPNNHWDI